MLLYPAIFTPDTETTSVSVRFPDIPEAITFGTDMNHAYQMADEVLGFALEDYSEYPEPSDISVLQETYPDSTIALIGVDMVSYLRKHQSKKVRKNVTVPEWLNNLAEQENLNFSQILTEALERKLQI
ncbi:type II toxin-antitoxin system HicB family antitoxin [Streptococcus sp. NLN64]|uniref:type II toxin-antitoxin system HicB family antitoxin n=1 Tax=Streptococcus sp. NLN64 TaxID=2822799 RepID=UPI0018C973CC|nr:type II toxin-antitoxin system HicB family antitoxin [Streptococcus sp. NLN64]MBG9366541.1 type II toxin-antitoxin system HicB family antitoxin [Streptococcus sp. NLN64]